VSQTAPFAHLPERIRGLRELAYNLWWSWQPDARNLFRDLGLYAWRESGHNPIHMLAMLPGDLLREAGADADYLGRYDAVMARFAAEVGAAEGWFSSTYGRSPGPIAYLSAEYGLHSSLRTYAGGLGILAGDYLKECSDLGVPLVAVGLIYSGGYVQQRIREDGWQDDVEMVLDRTYDPITPVLDSKGEQLVVKAPLFDPPVYLAVWKVAVGRVSLYLLDTDLEGNQPWDRAIAQHLYAGNPEQRLRQEIVLGMGGMKVLEALSIRPAALHINEGHPALALLERIRARVAEGESFTDAFTRVRQTSIFTTHTPVPAGTDIYSFALMEKYLGDYCDHLRTDKEAVLKLGAAPESGSRFNMTAFALRAAGRCNAVSRRHGQVARQMWAGLWPGTQVDDVPIAAITNGVHLQTWIEPRRLQPLLSRHLGPGWAGAQDHSETWDKVDDIPDADLWDLHRALKVSLIARINESARTRWREDKVAASAVLAFGALLDPDILTIGFARRFTAYKRADLIFHDLERFKRLLIDPLRPVQFVFAGIAHSADVGGKRLIQKIVRFAQDPALSGRIAFVEGYDQRLAEYFVHGVDVWLNTPLPPLEACGTSGMKAAVNGTPNLAVLDGWWIEAHDEANGWAFGGETIEGDRTDADAGALYRLLEERVVPLYYKRSDDGVPHDFVGVMKAAMKSVAPAFSARRMVKEYVMRFYAEALAHREPQDRRYP
jgi:starch phosphorylase